MKRFLKSFSLLLCSGLFAMTGWAAEPTADWSASFNGDTTCSGLFSGWSGNGDIPAASYVTTPNGSGFIAGTYVPWCDNSGITVANSFAFAVYADLSTVAPNSTIMGVGGAAWNGGSGFTLAKTAKDEVAVVRYGATDTVIARLKSDTIKTSSFMLYTVSIVQNDDSTVVTITAGSDLVTSEDTTKYTPTGNGLQVGACYGDTAYVQIDGVNTTKAANAIIDEVRAYSSSLTIEEITQLLEVFPTVKRPEVIAINFANNAADLGSSGLPTDAIGFEKVVEGVTYGGKVVPAFWTKTTGGVNNDGLDVASTIERQYRLKWSSNANTYQSGSTGTLTEKLTYGYLDNGDSTQNHIELSGLPITGYDVAVILGGDGPNSENAQNNKFSPVKVNGIDYTYDADNNLIQGTTVWGVRCNANALTEGTNVIFVPNQIAPTLLIDTYYKNENGNAGRGTIAAIQVFVHTGKESPVFPPLGEATSYWNFENSIVDANKGVTSWTGDNDATNAYVDSYRKSERGIVYKGAQMSGSLHPYLNGYAWSSEFTIMAYVNVAKCPDNGVLVSSGGATKLRKVNSTTIRFGGPNTYVDAECADLAVGYHLIIATFGNAGLTLQIDNGQVATNASKSTIANGIQIGAEWGGGTHSYNNDGGAVIDDLAIWNKVLTSDEMDLLKACYPAAYLPLSVAADTDASGALSWSEITAVVGNRTTWNVSGEVTISLDADIDPALTALTLIPANASGDKLTVTGAGSLYGDTFALTTDILVDITNQKNNPTITLSGAGNVTIRKGNGSTAGGIAPVANNYTGTFTVDDGQQITRMGGDLTIPFTVGTNGAKLHSNDGNWTVSSKISGSGTLTIASPSRWISVTNNTNDFTGNVVVESGTLYVGNKGSENSGSDAQLGDENSIYTVKSGATFYTHLGGNDKIFAPNITLEDGATFGNRDGHVTYNGDITINGNATYNFYWNKQNTFSGVVSGTGTLMINGPDNEDGTCEIRLTNAANTFTGTYKLAGKNNNRKIKLVACATTGAASYNLTNAYSILAFSGDVTANTLIGSAGSVESNASGTARTVTLTGNSDVRSLAVSNDITFAVTAGETYITSTTKATVTDGATVKVVLTADQKLSGLTLENVTVNDGGTVVFLDIDGTTELKSSDSNAYEAAQTSTYTVTVEGGSWNKDPANGDAITIAFGDITNRTLDESILPQGVTHLAGLTATGANASITAAFAAIADAVIIEDTLSIVGTEEETTVAGVISGDGQVKIAAGKVKFTNTNTYIGGTDIATNATLTMGNANAIGTTGNITGAGTLKFSGFVPANLSNLTVAEGGWTGTFYMMNRPSSGTFPVNEWGNANSTICLENCSGYLTPAGGATITSNFRVEGDGWRSQNGNGNAQFTFTGALSGSGKLEVATATPEAGNFYKFTGDVSKFTGYVNVTNNHRVVFGDADSQGNGKITIAKNVTIAAQKTWSAVNGIAIMEGATLTVNGAITGAIANAGTLIYGVDTTVSNTISGAGAIQVAAAKTVDLSAATLTNFAGTYAVGEGATLKLPLTATANKEIALGTDAKLLVVLNDEQKGAEQSVTVIGGSVQFVDANGNVLCNGASYSMPTYIVGEGWTGANLTANANITIDFAETTDQTVDLTAILGSVTTLSKLTVKGTNGGTITNTNSTVTACPIVEVLAGGRTNVPEALTSLATTVTGPTAEGSLLYVTGETTATTSRYPYTGNRHFETIKFTDSQSVGGDIDGYTVAKGETIEFLHNGGVRYQTSLVVDGGTIRTTQNTHVWLIGAENAVFTLKAGAADFSSISVDNDKDGLLIGYMDSTHTFDIQGGTLDASNTSIVGYQPGSHYRQSGGLVKTKGFRQNGSNFTEMTLTGGTIELGSGGLPNLGMDNATFSGATIHAVANNTVAEALNMTAASTLSAAADTTMTVTSTFTGAATLSIAGAGTVDLSGATIPNTIALNVAAGATAVVAPDQVSTFAKVTVPEGATLKVKLTVDCLISGRLNCTLGAESTLDGAIVLDGIEGETTTFTDGVLSVTFAANPTLTGNAWWWDYEFNGDVRSTGSDTAPLVLEGDGTSYVTVDGDNKALYFQKTPYRDNGNDVKARFAEVDTFTAVMYCQPGNHNNVPLVGFGSTTQNDKVAVVLATGAVAADGEMAIMLVKGDNHVVTPLADNLVVPNATKAYHLYAFTFDAQADKTVISVYVDGKLKKTTTVNEHFRVSNGFQIGSIHGGVMTNQTGLSKYPDSGDSGTIDFLRVTKGLLSADAMRALAEAYPYHSENGTATRTVAEATVNWVADDTWSQAMPNADAVQQAAPNNGTNVTLTANVATEVTVNLTEAVTYETVTVVGDDAVTFKKGEAATFKAGDITIGTDVTIEYGAIDVDTLIVNGGKTLTFDFTGYDFNSIYASKTLPLTGLATLGENADVEVALPTLPAYLTAECVFDANKSEYALAITVTGTLAATIENNAITWKVGNTVVTPPADLTAVESITMTVVGDNSVALTEDMTLASVVLTGEGGSVTFESGKLTVNNTLTMNNVNVMATPETLIAAVVTGTAGTETFTMHSQASYSHEQAFAMRFERCALTKTGSGTVPIAVNGVELDTVNVTLKNGALQLASRGGDPQIKDTTFTYVDANEDGVADGELTNYGWIHSTTTTTFIVPEGVTGRAVVGSCLTNTGAVVKQGAGTLVLGIMKTNNANPYTGATTVEAGMLAYHIVNNSANPFVMSSVITVEAGAAIKGVENCTFASLSFEAGAIVDATAAPVVATAVMLPTGDGAKVVLKKNASGDVLTYTGDVPNMNLFTTATTLENAMLGVKVNEGVVTLVLTQVSVPEVVIPDDATEEVRAELVKQQAEAEVAAQVVADALAASTDEETRTANVSAIENPGAASIIENADVELTQNEGEETYTAKFTYNFGVSALDVVNIEGQLHVVIMAKLDEQNNHRFANGVTVTVTDGNKEIAEAVAVTDMTGTTTTQSPAGNTRYFRFPLPTDLGTHSYKVRATK
ncbi:MAG: autotransporter-associated beta strand repeat-containing protein [Kiritimatiellae bacterium]|nr:autotransporter-associated beta strand repeat-containing protein [Kiritimatiellia bacterium]